MKFRNRISGIFMLLLMAFSGTVNVYAEDSVTEYIVGVAVYDPDSTEMSMFIDYYRNYIQEGFPVKFYFSESLSTAEDENAFIQSMKDIGAQGIISFAGYELQETLDFCEKCEMYYVLGSSMISDEVYEKVKDHPFYIGSVGPREDEIYESGRNMAQYFEEQGAGSYIIMSGGASRGNTRHAGRTQGMLEVLQEKSGLILPKDAEELAAVTENTVLYNEDKSVKVTICPDYTEGGEGLENLESAFAEGNYDALMSAFHASTYLDKIAAKEEEQQSNIMVGAIDSFTEGNFELIKEKDAFGNPSIDYVEGKYASMAGPAFAMLYNAMSGHPETNTPDGKAVRLYQSFWAAKGRKEFIELYGYASGIYENAYSCEDLMQVISVYNEDASPKALQELTEACTVEDVKARILE